MSSLAVVFAALLVAVPVADARRAPTIRERAAITTVVWRDLQLPAAARPCVTIAVTVSTVNTSWARGQAKFKTTPACLRYASNGYDLLRKRNGRWRIVFRGSDAPACGVVPPRVLRDLTGFVRNDC